MADENQNAGAQGENQNAGGEGEVLTLEQLHDAAITATEAYQADPSKDELKTAAQDAVKKTKDAIAAEKTKITAEAAKNKAPEKYELKIPEKSTLTQPYLDKIAATAKERGLSNERAQELVNEHNQARSEFMLEQNALVEKTQKEWLSTAQADKEFGGDGFKENSELAKRVLAKYGTPEFNAILSDPKQGLFGNHPELVRVLVRIGKAMSDDKLINSGAQGGKEDKSFADKFYAEVK